MLKWPNWPMRSRSNEKSPQSPPSGSVPGIVSLAVLGALFFAAVFYSMPSNVLDLRDGSPQRTVFTQVLPEAWGFFTKPPNDPELGAFRVSETSVESALAFPHSRAENSYGLTRKHRAQGPEVANLSAAVEGSEWVDCDTIPEDCILHAGAELEPVSVENAFPAKTLCGEMVIAETVPVTWAYRGSYEGWRIERRAISLDVRCD